MSDPNVTERLPVAVHVDPDFYNANPDAAVQLDGAVDLTLSRRVRAMAVEDGRTLVPEVGICTLGPVVAAHFLSRCYSPYHQVSLSMAWGRPAVPELALRSGPYAPFPTSAGFGPLDPTFVGSWQGSDERDQVMLVMDRPVAYVERSFQVRGLRMSEYKR